MSNSIAPTSLADQIQTFHDGLRGKIPEEIAAVLEDELAKLARSGIQGGSLGVGAVAPDFELPDQTGRPTRLTSVLARGPVVVPSTEGLGAPTAISSSGGIRRH